MPAMMVSSCLRILPSCSLVVSSAPPSLYIGPPSSANCLAATMSLARLAVFAWMVVVVIVARNDVANPWVAWGGLGVIGVWSLWEFARVRAPMTQRFAGIVTVIETGLAAALLIADPWVWTSTVGQRYASAWPLMPVLAAAIIWERRGGLVAAAGDDRGGAERRLVPRM